MKHEKKLGNVLKKFIERETSEMIKQCPCYAQDPSVIAYNEMKNSSKDYQKYLKETLNNFDDIQLRQIWFVCAKLSLRKYYPEKAHIIDKIKSENLTKKQLRKIIGDLK